MGVEELYGFWDWGFSFLVKSTPITYIMCYFVAFSLYFCACSCRFIFSLKGFFEFSHIPDFLKCGECPYIRFSKNVGGKYVYTHVHMFNNRLRALIYPTKPHNSVVSKSESSKFPKNKKHPLHRILFHMLTHFTSLHIY